MKFKVIKTSTETFQYTWRCGDGCCYREDWDSITLVKGFEFRWDDSNETDIRYSAYVVKFRSDQIADMKKRKVIAQVS